MEIINLNSNFSWFIRCRNKQIIIIMSQRPPTRQNSQGRPASQGATAFVSAGEVRKLKTQLEQARNVIRDLQEELQEQNALYQKALKQKDEGEEKFNTAKESMQRFSTLVQQKVDDIIKKERLVHAKTEEENRSLKIQVRTLQDAKIALDLKVKELQGQLQGTNVFDRGEDEKESYSLIKTLKGQVTEKDKEIDKLHRHVNYIQDQIEEFMDENKLLRDLAGAPADFGIARENVRLLDREKIDDYKKLIRVLQEDNYRLERERAELKNKIKKSYLVPNYSGLDNYDINNLSQDQKNQLDEFMKRLLTGQTMQPHEFYVLDKEHEALKAKYQVLEKRGFDEIKRQVEDMLQRMFKDGNYGGSMNDNQMNALQIQLADIVNLINGMGGKGASIDNSMNLGNLRPPVPYPNPDGSVNYGHSFKFDSQMMVTPRSNVDGGSANLIQENAFLQLQLQECFGMIDGKDELLLNQKREIDQLYGRIKRYVLMQDHLYKDFVKLEDNYEKQLKDKNKEISDLKADLDEASKRDNLQKMVDDLQKYSGANDQKFKLIELTKQNTLLEVNLHKMTRMYEQVSEQEKLLRRNYQEIEKDMTEMEKSCMERINSLKEWKRNATYQLKSLYDKLQSCKPEAEYKNLQLEVEISKQQYTDLNVKYTSMTEELSKLQTELRKKEDTIVYHKELKEYKEDLEKEFNYVRAKLENYDLEYRKTNALLYKIVENLKNKNMNITQAFEKYDLNKDHHISKNEMIMAFKSLGINNLTDHEVNQVMDAIDLDGSGDIDYKEFHRKLQRCGLRVMSKEDRLMFEIITSLKAVGLSKADLFAFIDKEGRQFITQQDFKELLRTRNIQQISDQDIDRFINYFYDNKKATMDLKSFVRVFEKYERKIEAIENPYGVQKMKRSRVSDEIIQKKQQIFKSIHHELQKERVDLHTFFINIDTDDSQEIQYDEWAAMLKNKMALQVSDHQLREIYRSIDLDDNGRISWAEFKLDFEKCVNLSLIALQEEERHMDALNHDSGFYEDEREYGQAIKQDEMTQILELKRKNLVLEGKLETAKKDIEMRAGNEQRLIDSINQTQARVNELRKENGEKLEAYCKVLQQVQKLEHDHHKMIDKALSEQIASENSKMKVELQETKSALLSHQSMNKVISEQVKSLKLMYERSKDENESLLTRVRELSSEDVDQQKLSKMHYVVMLSRWHEAAVNKKYESKLNEAQLLQKDIIRVQQESDQWEKEYVKSQQQIQYLRDENTRLEKLSIEHNNMITTDTLREIERRYSTLVQEREELEDQYFKVRDEAITCREMMERETLRADEASRQLKEIQTKRQDELTDELIKQSEKMQKLHLESLQAKRRQARSEEDVNHVQRLLQDRTRELESLEEKYTKLEAELTKKEQKWREADNERIRLFFSQNLASQNAAHRQERMAERMKGAASEKLDSEVNIGKTTLQRQQSALENMKDMTIEQLKDELARVKDESESQKRQINQMQRWNGYTEFMGWMKEFVDKDFKPKDQRPEVEEEVTQIHKETINQNNSELAEAAQMTIKTLNDMIKQKKEQLKTKDVMIDKLRSEIHDLNKMHRNREMQLQEQLQSEIRKNSETMTRYMSQEKTMHTTNPSSTFVPRGDNHVKLQQYQSQINALQQQNNRLEDELEQARSDNRSNRQGHIAEMNALKENVRELTVKLGKVRGKLKKQAETDTVASKKNEFDRIKEEFQVINTNLNKQLDELKQKNKELELEKKTKDKNKYGSDLIDNTTSEVEKAKKEVEKLKKDLTKAQNEKTIADTKLKKQLDQNKLEKQAINGLQEKLVKEQNALAKLRGLYDSEKMQHSKTQQQADDWKNSYYVQKEEFDRAVQEKHGSKQNVKTYKELEDFIKEQETTINVLNQQKKQVIALNPSTQAFEYIGEPVAMDRATGRADNSIKSVSELIKAIQDWLARPGNDRLTVQGAFVSLDSMGFGDLPKDQFVNALKRLGIDLKAKEVDMLQKVLDPNNMNQFKYEIFIREFMGVPQVEFVNPAVLKLAKVAEGRDLAEDQFERLMDPNGDRQLNKDQFATVIQNNQAADFSLNSSDADQIFVAVNNLQSVSAGIGVKMKTVDLVKQVMKAVKAVVVDKARQTLSRAGLTPYQVVRQHGSQGQIDENAFIKVLTDNGYSIGNNMKKVLLSFILNPKSANSRAAANRKINVAMMKSVFEACGSVSSGQSSFVPQRFEEEKQQSSGGIQNDKVAGMTAEETLAAKRAARKVLAKAHGNIVQLVAGIDHLEEGLVNKQELKDALMGAQIPDLELDELLNLLKLSDRGQKGYIATARFIDKLYDLSVETEVDQVLRRTWQAAERGNFKIADELSAHANEPGSVTQQELSAALKTMKCKVSDTEIDLLYKTMGQFSFDAARTNSTRANTEKKVIRVVNLARKAEEIAKLKPLPNYVLNSRNGNKQKTSSNIGSNQVQAFEAEKKYKKNLEMLKSEIEERNRRIEAQQAEILEGKRKIESLDAKLKLTDAKIADIRAKPPKETGKESSAYQQAQEIVQLQEKIHYWEEENIKLRKLIDVKLKAELSKLTTEKEQLEEQVQELKEENTRQSTQITALIGQPLDDLEKREELELTRQMKIDQLEESLEKVTNEKNEQQEQLFKVQEQLLTLKFEKETFDLQYARLQKRIQDLDRYKMSTANLSAQLKQEFEAEKEAMMDAMGKNTEVKKKESLKLRPQKPGKSIAELEVLVESLKRVIDKLKTENEALKKENQKVQGHGEKLASEKSMKQKISNLEQLVHSYQMKEVNLDEREKTIKKLIQANKQLREDLQRETERYTLLEDKYSDVLVRLKHVADENKRNEEVLFAMQTGTSFNNFKGFLTSDKE